MNMKKFIYEMAGGIPTAKAQGCDSWWKFLPDHDGR